MLLDFLLCMMNSKLHAGDSSPNFLARKLQQFGFYSFVIHKMQTEQVFKKESRLNLSAHVVF
jgi:hypothetical protein